MIRLWAPIFLAVVMLAQGSSKVIADAKAKSKAGEHDAAVAALEAAAKASPKDAALKKALGEAHLAAGDFYYTNEKLPPFRKYPAALRSYRKVLEFDKDNAKAKANIATIEGIYKQMGRPVPQ